jgi:hypothetical protein
MMRSKIVDRTPQLDPAMDADAPRFAAQARQCFKLAAQATDTRAAEALEILGCEFAVRGRNGKPPRAEDVDRPRQARRVQRQSIDGLPPRDPLAAPRRRG